MTEKCTLELALVLPDIPDERDACVRRLTELLLAEGMEISTLFAKTARPAWACTTTRSGSA